MEQILNTAREITLAARRDGTSEYAAVYGFVFLQIRR
jgi:hypothetical protein